jgi:hypothetical protein
LVDHSAKSVRGIRTDVDGISYVELASAAGTGSGLTSIQGHPAKSIQEKLLLGIFLANVVDAFREREPEMKLGAL